MGLLEKLERIFVPSREADEVHVNLKEIFCKRKDDDFIKRVRTPAIGCAYSNIDGSECQKALAKLSFGCVFAFAMALCVQCETCAYPDPCLYPHLARPSMDVYGIDIGKTLEPLNFKVEFDEKGNLPPSWYCMVLLE